MNLNILRLLCVLLLSVGITALISASAEVHPSERGTVGVSVRAINYSGKEVVLMVRNPKDKTNSGGGDALNPYGIGGSVCCFGIPAQWHPGYQVVVKYNFYPDEEWHEQLVHVPPYPAGIADDIWLVMREDGEAEAIVSSFGPTRPEWPGRTKGWPVPSRAYAAKVRNDQLATKKGMLQLMERGLADGSVRTKEQTDRMKSAIEYTKAQIREMDAVQP
ncbi:DUF3304 domain-containing protein [Duganella aceris]|uniref:DUF3304 domain-containing protein n=1 Tax=Duganella aceris TaxID=2703883 RepID=A0ABX0FL63_9BURK|nr:DUF3304 domain-containing protein [Duganella aceris]NGZ85329.1 DUF3304 domain-containing protein [Duganella aceris]